MKKLTILLGIIPSVFLQSLLYAQETPTTEELLKRIEALEAKITKQKIGTFLYTVG